MTAANLIRAFRERCLVPLGVVCFSGVAQGVPTITQQPVCPLIALGNPGVTLSVAATGTGSLSYQWWRNGAILPGATQASLPLTPLDHTTRGVYQVRVTDDDGSTMSRMTRVGHAAGDLIFFGGGDGGRNISRMAKGVNVSYLVDRNGRVGGGKLYPMHGGNGPVYGYATVVTVVGPGIGNRLGEPAGLDPVVSLASAGSKAFCVEVDGEVKGWLGTAGDWYSGGPSTPYLVPTNLGPCLDVSMNDTEVVVVKADGTVTQWAFSSGAVTPPEISPPAGLVEVMAVSSSSTHHLAVKRDGTVVGWGQNTFGQCDVPAGLAQVAEVCAGTGFSLALKSDGTVVAWGDNSNQQTQVPSNLANVVSIYAGTNQCMAAKSDGSLVCWGGSAPDVPWYITSAVSPGIYEIPSSWNGGMTPGIVRPYAIPAITQAPVSIATRPDYSVTLEAKASGFPEPTVRWQKNGVDIPGATNAKFVIRNVTAEATGDYRAVFTNSVGSCEATATVSLLDEPVITSQPVDQNVLLDAPAQFSVSVTAPASNASLPVSIQWLRNGFIIPGATQSTLSIAQAGLADVGDYQAVINGTTANGLSLVPGAQRSKVARLRIKGEPVTWGRQGYSSDWLKNYSTQIPSGLNVADTVEITASELSFLIRDASGMTRQWNILGQTTTQGLPTQPVAMITSGYGRFATIDLSGNVQEWFADISQGNPLYNSWYLTMNPVAAKVVSPRSGASDTTLESAVSAAGQPWFHGAPLVKLSCGAYHNLGLLQDGGISAWVSRIAVAKPNSYSNARSGRSHLQSTVPAGFMAGRCAAAVAAGAYHNLVLFSDGTVGAWGKNDAGQATVPAGLSQVVRIAAFGDTSIAIKADGQIVSWGRLSNTPPALDRPPSTPVTPMQSFRRRHARFTLSSTGTPTGTQISLDRPGGASLGYTSGSSISTSGATLTLNSGGGGVIVLQPGGLTYNSSISLGSSNLTSSVTTIGGGTLSTGSTTSLAGIITSGSTLTLGSSGSLVLSGTNSGVVPISAGTPLGVSISGSSTRPVSTVGGTLTLNTAGTSLTTATQNILPLTITSGSVITTTGLIKTGSSSTLDLSGISSTTLPVISGNLTLNSGTLTLAQPLSSIPTTASTLTINSGNVTLATADLSASSASTIILGAGATLTLGTVTHTGPLTLQRQTDGSYLPSTVTVSSPVSTSATIATVNSSTLGLTTTGSILNLNNTTGSTSGVSILDPFTLPTLDLGGLSWDPSLFILGGGGPPVEYEEYTSHDSPALALPVAAAEIGTRLSVHELGGLLMAPNGGLACWGLLPALPADLLDIVDAAANQYGVIALRAYTAPRIVLHPANQEIFTGYTGPIFRCSAAGFPAPALQWQKGMDAVAGQTLPTFTINQAAVSDAGSYRLIATNTFGSATSDPAVLSVTTPEVFTAWKAQNFTPAAVAAGQAAPHADPGGLGVPNLLRYALGLDPNKPDAGELPRLAFGRHPFLPANVGGLFFCVPENVSDVTFRLGVSHDLTTWKALDVEPVLGPVTNGKRQVWLPCPPDEQDVRKTFYKLIIEPAPASGTPVF